MLTSAAFRKLLTAAAAATVFAATAMAQTTIVKGKIIGSDGKPAEGVEIRFQRTDQRANYNIKTKKDGTFNYATLPMGIYTISVLEKGEVKIKQEGVRTNPAQPIELNLDIAKVMAEATAAQQQQQQAAAAGPAPGGAPQAGGAPAQGEEPRMPTEEEIKKHEAELAKAKEENDEIEAKNKALNDSFNAGMAATQAKDWNGAIEAFVRTAQLDPKQHVAYARLGESYSERAKLQRGAAGTQDYGRAAEAYARAVELLPTDAAYRNNYMIALARAQKMDDAKAQAAEAVKLNPATAGQVYRNLGTIYFDTNQFAAAEDMFKQAIAAEPKAADNHYRMGLVLLSKMTPEGKLVQPKETEEAFKEYLKLAPNGAEAENAKAMLSAIPAMK